MNSYTVIRGIAALMLLIAMADLPYAYYQILRWVVCGASAYGAVQAHETQKTKWTWLLGVLAVLFNPIAPIYLDKATWSMVDLIASVLLAVSIRYVKVKD